MDWVAARGRLASPIFAPLATALARLPADRWPTHEEMTALAEGIVTVRGKQVRFVAPREHTDRERRYYELRIADSGEVETRPGKTGQRTGVDMGFVDTVTAGDESGQHAGIGCVHLAADQGKAHARDRLHAELAQHRNVGVAGADQHDVLQHGMARALHVGLSSHEGSECW